MFTKKQIPLAKGALSTLALFVVLFAFISRAQATIMKFLDVEDLTQASTHVFTGQVLSTAVSWTTDHQNIYTAIQIRVNESLKGPLSQGDVITVKQLGGEIDGVSLEYEGRPIFQAGESVVLFTKLTNNGSFVVTGLKQGKMRIEGSTVIRDLSGIMLVSKQNDGRLQQIAPPKTQFMMSELRTRIVRAR